MLSSQTDYRQILRAAFDEKSRVIPKYSLRAFGRELGLTSSRLSEIFQGKQGISVEVAHRIGLTLGMLEADLAYFCDLVEVEHARSAVKRKAAAARLRHSALNSEFHVLGTDVFHMISDWHHAAILQLFETNSFEQNAEWIASRLGISAEETEQALDRLVRLQLLKKMQDGKKQCLTQELLATTDGVPSSAIRKFHHQILAKAIRAIEQQSVNERSLSANIFAIDEKRLEKASESLKRFRRRFMKEFGKAGPSKNAVYCLSTQLFAITTKAEVSHV